MLICIIYLKCCASHSHSRNTRNPGVKGLRRKVAKDNYNDKAMTAMSWIFMKVYLYGLTILLWSSWLLLNMLQKFNLREMDKKCKNHNFPSVMKIKRNRCHMITLKLYWLEPNYTEKEHIHQVMNLLHWPTSTSRGQSNPSVPFNKLFSREDHTRFKAIQKKWVRLLISQVHDDNNNHNLKT